jgi:hypothetical protein
MQRVLASLLFLLMPIAALADGKVIPPTAFPSHIDIPDQQALIHFTNGTERLVIETRFVGAGTNFAWVIPLPSQPAIEAATAGVFPTLQRLFQPTIDHDVTRYYVGFLILAGLGCLLHWLARRPDRVFVLALFVLFALALAMLLMPVLSRARGRGMDSVTAGEGVSILDRQLVGVFETATISSPDPRALQTWLTNNGFALSTNVAPVIQSYVRDGWVFVAAKSCRDQPDWQTNSLHPLSFTFKTDKPVYPMRLTGIDNGPLRVDLYVFGPAQAKAAHFSTERCTRPGYPPMTGYWSFRQPESLNIVHPLLRRWCEGSPVATKLTATLTPADMRSDVWIEWTPFSEIRRSLFSREGARIYALNWGAAIFAGGLILGWIARRSREKREPRPWFAGEALLASLALAGAIYLLVPKTEVRLARRPSRDAYHNLYRRIYGLESEKSLTLPRARAALADPSGPEALEKNLFLDGVIHEEDSPGNYVLREKDGHLQYVAYDGQGAEEVMLELDLP